MMGITQLYELNLRETYIISISLYDLFHETKWSIKKPDGKKAVALCQNTT